MNSLNEGGGAIVRQITMELVPVLGVARHWRHTLPQPALPS